MQDLHTKRTFNLILSLYFCIYFCLSTIAVNIDNLIATFGDIAQFGIGIVIICNLLAGTISMLLFGYYTEYLSKRLTRKRLFMITNLFWIIPYGLIGFSPNYGTFLTLIIIGALGNGAFLPIGFLIIGDLYKSEERGNKFGFMQFGLILGNGIGAILGGVLGWRLNFAVGSVIGLLALLGYLYFGEEPNQEFIDSEEKDNYQYKITYQDLVQLVKTKTVLGILLFVLCSGIAVAVLSNWAIFHLTLQLNSKSHAIFIYLIAGLGALPGAIMGGQLGDIFSKKLKVGRVYVSVVGMILGTLLLITFYSFPFILFGMFGYFFVFFSAGNRFAICSDLVIPKLKSTVNALNGIMINIGGIIGNVLISSLIHNNIGLISLSITLVIIIWLAGSVFWIFPYLYYDKERVSQEIVAINVPTIQI